MVEIAERQTEGNVPVIRIDALDNRVSLGSKELWQYRELLYFLVWREVTVRYKQTAIGIIWAVLQPLTTMIIFAVIFGNFVRIPSDGLPYSIFAYTALLPWMYFAQAVGRSGHSLVGDAPLLQKVYFPRLILPLAAVIVPLLDFLLAFVVLLGMIVWYGIAPTWSLLALPLFLLMALLTALAMSFWVSPLNVKYRDVNIVIPVVIQLWMYASPVLYPLSVVPDKWKFFYSLNPMVGVINGFRWALLGQVQPDFELIAVSALMVALVLWRGLVFFRRMEPTFADIV